MNKKVILILLVIILISGVLLFWSEPRNIIEQFSYDLMNANEYVSSEKQLNAILSSFPVIKFSEIHEEFQVYSKMKSKVYYPLIKKSKFYVIKKKDLYRRIVGNNRIKDIISKEPKYLNTWYFSDTELYLGIDKRILHKALELQHLLSEKGLNKDGFKIRSGHRTPVHNERVGGASKSRHIKGEALDLIIGDINNDHVYTVEDKEIVLKLCKNKIIGNKGGIGLYPGTKVVHIDVRGYKARWNSF